MLTASKSPNMTSSTSSRIAFSTNIMLPGRQSPWTKVSGSSWNRRFKLDHNEGVQKGSFLSKKVSTNPANSKPRRAGIQFTYQNLSVALSARGRRN